VFRRALLEEYGSDLRKHANLTVRTRAPFLHLSVLTLESTWWPCDGLALQLYDHRKAAIAAAVRRLVEGPGTPGARPRLVVLCVGNGAQGTNFAGRPPSSHRVVERALFDVPNVAVVRVHEAGTTKVRLSSWRGGGPLRTLTLWGRARYGLTRWAAKYLPDERFAAQPRLTLARPVPSTNNARGLRMAPGTGIIYNRDAMSGMCAPAASDAPCPSWMGGW
jgi:hypothetical protein